MSRRFRTLIAWLALVVMVVLAGCSGKKIDPATGSVTETKPPEQQAEAPKSGGTLRLFYPNVSTIDPQLNSFGLWTGMDGIFEGLTRLNDSYTDVEPALAENWKVSDDRKVYTFNLRQNAKWSNGDPVTAHDFVFAFRRLIDPATKAFVSWGPTYLANYTEIKDGKKPIEELGVKAVDDYTLEITLAAPANDFLITMALPTALPVPKKVIEQHGPNWTDLDKFASNGPWMVDKFELNTKLELVPNPNYWGEKADLDRVVLYLNPAQLMAFENDEVDIMPVSLADLDTVRKSPELSKSLVELQIKNYDLINYPVNSEPAAYNRKFRQALAMSIDKEQIAQTVMKGTVSPAWASIPVGVPAHDDSLGLPFDVAKAKQALAEAGYPDGKGAPPIHILVNGVNPSPFILAIKDEWEKNLGLTVEVEALESGAFAQKRNALQPPGQVSLFMTAFQVAYPSPRVVHTSGGKDLGRTQSLSAENRVTYFQMLDAANQEKDADKKRELIAANAKFLVDMAPPETVEYATWFDEIYAGTTPEREVELMKKIQQFDRQNAVFVPLFWQKTYLLVKPHVKNLKPNPFMNGRFYWHRVSIEQ